MCTILAGAGLAALAGYGGAAVAGLSTAATVGTVLASAASGAAAGAEYEAAEYNEKVAKANEEALKAQAVTEREIGSSDAQKRTLQTKQEVSRAAVELSSRGYDVSTGTASDLLAQSAQMGALDSMTILNNANRRAYGYEAEGKNLVRQAKSRKKTALYGMGQSILTSSMQPMTMGAI